MGKGERFNPRGMGEGAWGARWPVESEMRLTPMSRRPLKLATETLEAIAAGIWPEAKPFDEDVQASILIATFNQLPLSRLCLLTLLALTEGPSYEVIIVDNASNDGTAEFLKELSPRYGNARVVFNAENKGFAAANNQAAAMARGKLLVLLNNDTIVTPGWLGRLAGHLDDRTVGIVGPVTNRTCNEQQVDVGYDTFGGLMDESRELVRKTAGQTSELPMAAMFCAALRREVWNEIGPLDEGFGIGMFEDDDYSMRIRRLGLKVVCAEDVLIHHFGEGSLGEMFRDGTFSDLFHRNKARFETKWGVTWKPHGRRVSEAHGCAVERFRSVVLEHTPERANILVISKGEEGLLGLPGRRAAHFPADAHGDILGYAPSDSGEVIRMLKEAKAMGAEYLAIPGTALWWLEHYQEFAKLIESGLLCNDADCALFSLVHIPLSAKRIEEGVVS